MQEPNTLVISARIRSITVTENLNGGSVLWRRCSWWKNIKWQFSRFGLIIKIIIVPDVHVTSERIYKVGPSNRLYSIACVCLWIVQRMNVMHFFFPNYERLLNLCLLELEGEVMSWCGIQVYGWPKEVSIIHKVRPLNAAWRQIDLAKEARWQTDHFIRLPQSQITSQCCCTQSD